MSLRLRSSGGGSITLQEPVTATDNTLTLPAANGSITAFVSSSLQATTSGTTISFTNVPDWVKKVNILFNGVSTSGTNNILVQLGTSAGLVTSGYAGAAFTVTDSANPGATAFSNGFLVRLGGAATAAAVRHGIIILTKMADNTWIANINIGLSNLVYNCNGAGSISLAGLLTQIAITTVGGTDTFDAGSINVMYEG